MTVTISGGMEIYFISNSFSSFLISEKLSLIYLAISESERGENLITIALERIVGRIQLSCSAVAKRNLFGSGSSHVFKKAFIEACVIL
jgi:hypothetical protein